MTVAERDWVSHWRNVAPLAGAGVDDALRQVGKTIMGRPVAAEQLDVICASLARHLKLTADDHVMDLGCGNGVLTERIAAAVGWVTGVDVSTVLVADATRFRSRPNIEYRAGDLTSPETLGPATQKAYAYEVLQHLTAPDLVALLEWLRCDRTRLRFVAASIPDRDRLHAFYDTAERREHYRRTVAAGTEQIGTWWTRDQVVQVGTAHGFRVEILSQDPQLYTAHYRFDAMFQVGG